MPSSISRSLVGPHKLGTEPSLLEFPEAATQTFITGDPLTLSSGKATILRASTGALTTETFLGFAEEDASGTTDDPVKVWNVGDEDILVLPVSAAGASQVTAQSQVGATGYGLYWDATNRILSVNISDTTNRKVQIVGIVKSYPVGEAFGQVYAKVLPAARTIV